MIRVMENDAQPQYPTVPGAPVQSPAPMASPPTHDPLNQFRPKPVGPNSSTLDVAVRKVEQVMIFMYVFVAALLLFRFVLSLFGANRQSLFVDFIYQLTTPFMFPFEGMFGGQFGMGDFVIEFEIGIALAVYALVFFGIARLVRIILTK